jgi:hypothetical protein
VVISDTPAPSFDPVDGGHADPPLFRDRWRRHDRIFLCVAHLGWAAVPAGDDEEVELGPMRWTGGRRHVAVAGVAGAIVTVIALVA